MHSVRLPRPVGTPNPFCLPLFRVFAGLPMLVPLIVSRRSDASRPSQMSRIAGQLKIRLPSHADNLLSSFGVPKNDGLKGAPEFNRNLKAWLTTSCGD